MSQFLQQSFPPQQQTPYMGKMNFGRQPLTHDQGFQFPQIGLGELAQGLQVPYQSFGVPQAPQLQPNLYDEILRSNQFRILSLLLKIELGEDGILRPIARGAESLTREISMLSSQWGTVITSDSRTKGIDMDYEVNMLQLKLLNLGIRADSTKLKLGQLLANYLVSSAWFMSRLANIRNSNDTNAQTDNFVRGKLSLRRISVIIVFG